LLDRLRRPEAALDARTGVVIVGGSTCAVDPSMAVDSGAITPGVRFHNMVTVSLGGTGTISRIINNTGGPSNSSRNVANLANYP
jgi:hypothetical protein